MPGTGKLSRFSDWALGWTTGESGFDCWQRMEVLSTAARLGSFWCHPSPRPDGPQQHFPRVVADESWS